MEEKNIKTNEDLAEFLGFYFLVFQKDYWSDSVKCWVDGSEDYVYYSTAEMRKFISYTESLNLRLSLERTFNDTGIFMWDVEEGKIKRLNASNGKEKGIMEYVLDTGKELKTPIINNPFSDLFSIKKNRIEIRK